MVNFGYPYNDIVICKDSTDYLGLRLGLGLSLGFGFYVTNSDRKVRIRGGVRLAPMWQQSGTLLFCSCHEIAGFLVDELQI